MNPMSLCLACLLALQTPTPPQARCDLTDNRCKAERDLQRARTAKNDEHRARHLFYAHRSYLLHFDQTGDTSVVCKARRAFDESVAIEGQPADQRAAFLAELEDLTSRERKAGVRCRKAPKRPSADPPRLAKKPAKKPTATTATGTTDETPAAPTSTAGETSTLATTDQPHAPVADPLLPVTRHRADNVSRPATTPRDVRPAGETRATPPENALPGVWRSPRPGRELLIAGGVALGVGLGLATAAGVMGGRMLDTWRESRALHDNVGSIGTEEQAATDAALLRDYRRHYAPMLATAVLGGSALVIGAVLVGVGAKRLGRVTSHAALFPTPGGLVLRARF